MKKEVLLVIAALAAANVLSGCAMTGNAADVVVAGSAGQEEADGPGVAAAEGREAFVNRVQSRNGLHTLENAEAIGLGSRSYQLVDISE
ncbi:MAG: hypothetical protein LUE86_11775 [Clostridiales bacterium]|nr:hypothetical protein [Clostridiales bacterium]